MVALENTKNSEIGSSEIDCISGLLRKRHTRSKLTSISKVCWRMFGTACSAPGRVSCKFRSSPGNLRAGHTLDSVETAHTLAEGF